MAHKLLVTWRVLFSFLRVPAIYFALVLPLLGLTGLISRPTGLQVFIFLCVGIDFHIFAFVLNDFIDLSVDRTQPLRANDPLVQGVIQPWHALLFALVQVPIAFILTFLATGNVFAILVLAIAFGSMSIYDIWGKRCFFPLLTDFSQGLAWAMLVLYGPVALQHESIPTITWVISAFIIVFIVMSNGVHGSLRDASNDLRHHRRTMALLLGVRPGERRIIISIPMVLYAFFLQLLLTCILLIPLANNSFGYDRSTWHLTLMAVVVLAFLSLAWPLWVVRSKRDVPQLIYAGILHLGLTLFELLIICAPLLQPGVLVLVIGVYFTPILSVRQLRQRITRRWSKLAIRS